MKIAVCIKGISYKNDYDKFNRKTIIDFERSLKNLKRRLFNPLRKRGNELDFFLKTYESVKQDRVVQAYQPKDYMIVPYKSATNTYKIQAEHLIDLFYMVRKYEVENNTKYDLILTLRFDMFITKKFRNLNIDYTKFNISFRCEKYPYIDDCLHLFPRKYIVDYAKILFFKCIVNNIRTHDILPYMKFPINYMIDGNYLVNNNPLFKIIRIYK